MTQTKSGWSGLFVALVWAIGGCGSTPSESIGKTTEAIGTECATAAATMTFVGGINVTSPQTYDVLHCLKAQVYDVQPYDGTVGSGPQPSLSTLVKWADTRPAVSACAAAWIGSDLFVRSGSAWAYLGSQSANGAVVNGGCFVPSLFWTTEMQNGQTYRVTASARTFNGTSAPTRKVLTQTYANGVPDKCLGNVVADSNQCTIDMCDPGTGLVSHPFAAEGTPCPDGLPCNGDEQCHSGACVPGTAPVIDDSNPCTADSCDPRTGAPVNTPTPGVVCSASSCSAGAYTAPNQCDAIGVCSPSTPTSCGNYACSGSACATSCSSQSSCSSTAYCDRATSACLPRVAPYGVCASDTQCAGNTRCAQGLCCDPSSTVDPLASSPISSSVPTDFVTQVAPLYSGSSPTQIIVPGKLSSTQVAVIRGTVLDELGAPLPCATISVVGAPEVGSTLTRHDGVFAIAVNGGAPVTIRVQATGYLSADRQVDTKWHTYAHAQNVVLLQPPAVSAANLVTSSSTDTTIVSGAPEADAGSTHMARLLVPAGTTATVAGTSTTLSSFNVLVKETTNLSKYGRDGMPATLPPTSAFTYAVTLAVAGYENQKITLNHPAAFYVENFVGITHNGEYVPVGYYDTDKAQWVASEIDDGKLFTIFSKKASGEAQLDLDDTPGAESDAAADTAGINVTERMKLGALYSTGQSLIRFSTSHFTTFDANWAYGIPDARPPHNPPPNLPPCGCCGSGAPPAVGSIIDCEKRGLREEVPVAGTPFNLFYSSRNQQGGMAPLHIPVADNTLPKSVDHILLEIQIAGRTFEQSWQVTPSLQLPLSYDFYWDGTDASGRRLYGAQSISTRIVYSYLGVYEQTGRFGYPGNGVAISAPTDRFFASMIQDWVGTMANWDAKQSGLGGWDLDVHQGYDPLSGTLHLGTGDEQPVPASLVPMQTITTTWRDPSAGNGFFGFPTNDGAGVPLTTGIVVDTDGSVYFVDNQHGRIGRLSRDNFAPGGDGKVDVAYGPGATTIPPNPTPPNPIPGAVSGLAMGPDHKLYVCDIGHNRILRVDPITHLGEVFAGSASPSAPLSDGPALTSALTKPYGIAVANDGTVYFTEGGRADILARVRRIRDGQITTIAVHPEGDPAASVAVSKDGSVYYAVAGQGGRGDGGTGERSLVYKIAVDGTESIYAGGAPTNASYGDGGPATSANLGKPAGIAFGPDGSLYMSDIENNTIRRVDADGVISTVVGNPLGGINHDGQGNSPSGLAPLSTLLWVPAGVAFDSQGMLYITDNANGKIRATSNTALTNGTGYIPSADGAHLYLFDANFQHIKTVDAHTGIPEYFFRYSSPGHLIGISNRDLNDPTRLETQISRDSGGNPKQIISPFGQTTTLSVVGGQLLSIRDPNFGAHAFSYYPGGLIQTFSEPTFPSNVSYAFEFTNGQLSKDTDPYGNSQKLSISEVPGFPGSQRVTYSDQLSRNTYYDIVQPDPTTMMSVVTTPGALSTVKSTRTDGTASYVAPNQVAYSSRQSNPDGSSAYWQTANDGVSGLRSPFVSSRLDFMGSTTDPVRTTSSTRSPTLLDPSDLSSVSSFSQTDSVNTRSTVLSYSKATQTFTTTSPAGRTTTRQVDSFGRTARFQVGNLAPTLFTYDDSTSGTGTGTQQISLTEQVDPGASPSSLLDRTTAYTYFPVGSGGASGYLKQIARSQSLLPGQTTTFTRDAFGRVLTSTTGGDAATFTWDGNGNLSTVTPPAGSGHHQTHTYLNQLLQYLPPVTTPSTAVNTSYTYTPDRKLLTETNPDGIVTTRDYDTLTGRPLDITGYASGGGIVGYNYFAAGDLAPGHSPGQLMSISRGGNSLDFTYVGRLMASANWHGAGSVAWSYDNDFSPITETITDALGTSAAIKFGYGDLDHFLTCASLATCPGTDALAVAHDSNGLLSSVNYGTLTEAYGYNAFGELASKTAKLGTAPLLQSTYDSPSWVVANRRDALGRISHREETVFNGTTTAFDYTYSAEGRLTDVLKNSSPYEHYEYSTKNGNRIVGSTPQRNVSSTQIQYDYPQDRLLNYGPYAYTYTNNGELKTKTDSTTSPASVTTYAYDTLGNLLSVTPTGGQAITYVIDGMNRRVGKLVGGTTIKQWLYRDSLKPVAELDGQGHLVSTFVYASNSNVPDYMVRAGKTYRILTDQLGSPRMVVNVLDSSDVAFKAEYTAFGEQTVTVGAADFLPFGFAAGMSDVDSGLVRFGARDYDPMVGRWISKDPIRFDGGQANLYVYLNNDPVNGTDPSGLIGPIDLLKCLYYEWRASDALDDCQKQVQEAWSKPGLDSMCEMPGGSPHDQYIECLKNKHSDVVSGFLNSCASAAKDAAAGGFSGQPGAGSIPGRVNNFNNNFPGP